MTEILPYLFLGTLRESRNERVLLSLGITHLLCVADSFRFPTDPSLKHLHRPLSDEGFSKLSECFESCFEFIDDASLNQGKVFLFCRQAQNRSPSILIAYLMCSKQMNLRDAYSLVQTRHRDTSPHESYFAQLQQYEKALFGEVSFTEVDRGGSAQDAIRRLRGTSEN